MEIKRKAFINVIQNKYSKNLFSIFLFVLFMFALNGIINAETKDSCINCHKNPDFKVTNVKLYKYFQQWQKSVHRKNGVSCVNCHLGNPSSDSKKLAHLDDKNLNKIKVTNFKQIPKTCSVCHQSIFKKFKQSQHFMHINPKKNELQGPTCITCHNSMNNVVVSVSNVESVCGSCHNKETKNHPEIPATTEYLLNKMLSIKMLYSYINYKTDLKNTDSVMEKIDDKMVLLSDKWHTFDLKSIRQDSFLLLQLIKNKKAELERK